MLGIKNLPLASLVQYHGSCLSSEGKSQRTIEWYAANLKRFLHFLKIRHLPDEVNVIGVTEACSFILYLQNEVSLWQGRPCAKKDKRLSPSSVKGYVKSIKAFWYRLLAEGYLDVNPMERLKVPKVPRKVIATFSEEQIRKLISQVDLNTASGVRDHVIILLLLDTGIRLSELAGLRLENIDFKQSCLLVQGKGNKERIVPLGTQVRRLLWRYINSQRVGPEFSGDNYLLMTNRGSPLTRYVIRQQLSRLGSRAGISGVRCSAQKTNLH